MKIKPIRIILALAVFSFLFQACADDEPSVRETCNDGIKNQDEAGIDCWGICQDTCPQVMTARINGTNWNADVVSSNYITNSQFTLSGRKSPAIYPQISLVYTGSLSLGTFPLNASSSYTHSISSFMVFNNGSITISNIDTRNHLVYGSFNMQCTETSSGTVYNITDGIFEYVMY